MFCHLIDNHFGLYHKNRSSHFPSHQTITVSLYPVFHLMKPLVPKESHSVHNTVPYHGRPYIHISFLVKPCAWTDVSFLYLYSKILFSMRSGKGCLYWLNCFLLGMIPKMECYPRALVAICSGRMCTWFKNFLYVFRGSFEANLCFQRYWKFTPVYKQQKFSLFSQYERTMAESLFLMWCVRVFNHGLYTDLVSKLQNILVYSFEQ